MGLRLYRWREDADDDVNVAYGVFVATPEEVRRLYGKCSVYCSEDGCTYDFYESQFQELSQDERFIGSVMRAIGGSNTIVGHNPVEMYENYLEDNGGRDPNEDDDDVECLDDDDDDLEDEDEDEDEDEYA